MATTVQSFITDLASKHTHAYANADILSWVNLVESNVYADVAKSYAAKHDRLIKDV